MKLRLLFASLAQLLFCSSFSQNFELDANFGINGIVSNPTISINNGMRAIALQADHKIITLEGNNAGGQYGTYLRRYNPDGSADVNFAGTGSILINQMTLPDYEKTSIKLQTDGKILFCGQVGSLTLFDFGVMRFNTDGSVDTSFGNNGLVSTDFAGDVDIAYDILIQSDGKFVVVGNTGFPQQGDFADFAAVRFNPNGSIDTTFGNNGKVSVDFGTHLANDIGGDSAHRIAIDSDGKFVIGGSTYNYNIQNGDDSFAIIRLNPDGSLDTTFGSGGKLIT